MPTPSARGSFKVYEKAGTLRISVQDVKNPGSWPGQAVQGAKVALESVVGVAA